MVGHKEFVFFLLRPAARRGILVYLFAMLVAAMTYEAALGRRFKSNGWHHHHPSIPRSSINSMGESSKTSIQGLDHVGSQRHKPNGVSALRL
ncbi:hypothetical protein V8C37DRAFT_387553 [Trichoderma ceciliae]